MAAGQAVLTSVLDTEALGAVQDLVERLALDRCAAHGQRLRAALRMHAVLSGAGAGLGTTAMLALHEQTSEQAAQMLLAQAQLLGGLPGGLEALECGLLTVEQATLVTRRLLPLPADVQHEVWVRLQARLLSAFAAKAVLPPARLAELLARWTIEADPAGAIERRKAAEAHGSVDYRRRDDGLADLFLNGVTGPNAQAILSRIRDRARRCGAGDDRTVEKRRLDAAVDLLLGRDQLPLDDSQNPFDAMPAPRCGGNGVPGSAPCGCRPGEPVPCGVQVSLLVPLGAALGTTDEVAVLEGHGPIEPDLLQALLHTAPTIRPVWVDEHGVPVAVGDRAESPSRGDPAAVREALLRLTAQPPGPPQPRHPDDHQARPEHASPPGHGPARPVLSRLVSRRPLAGPQLLQHPHPVGTPGPYRVPSRLARLLRVRSPRCEWAGCGHRAAGCDLDHDLAHPAGPTCGCNLGPLCRRHHRLKQLLMHKTRGRHSEVTWTSPTGRRWTSPSQHDAPAPSVRPAAALPDLRGLGDPYLDEDGSTDLAWLDGTADRLRADEPDPDAARDEGDPFVWHTSNGWGLTLDDPTRWGSWTAAGGPSQVVPALTERDRTHPGGERWDEGPPTTTRTPIASPP